MYVLSTVENGRKYYQYVSCGHQCPAGKIKAVSKQIM
jgi:hypothetical protein